MSAYPPSEFRTWAEFTVMRRVDDHWERVGITGSLETVKGEMADWRRDCPDDVFVYAQRQVGPWNFGDEKEHDCPRCNCYAPPASPEPGDSEAQT